MIPRSSLCCMGDGHGVTEGEKRGKKEEEGEVEEATTAKQEIRSGLEGSEDKAVENEYRKGEKV